jgi:hypothetical protein
MHACIPFCPCVTLTRSRFFLSPHKTIAFSFTHTQGGKINWSILTHPDKRADIYLMPAESLKRGTAAYYELTGCVRACVRACVRVCVRACVRACVRCRREMWHHVVCTECSVVGGVVGWGGLLRGVKWSVIAMRCSPVRQEQYFAWATNHPLVRRCCPRCCALLHHCTVYIPAALRTPPLRYTLQQSASQPPLHVWFHGVPVGLEG